MVRVKINKKSIVKMKGYKENIALGIFIFSVLTVIVLVSFAFNGNVTGKVIQEDEENPVQNIEKSCTDSDGKNYGVKGIVNYCNKDCSSKEDSCSGKKVVEFYCENNEKKYEEHDCEVDCDDGVCLSISKKYTYPYSYGGSGSIGGGSVESSPVSEETGQTYDLGEINSENKLNMKKNDNARFSISGTAYSLQLQDVTENQATFPVAGVINVGEEKTIDLNNDGNSELYVKVDSINVINKGVQITLRLNI